MRLPNDDDRAIPRFARVGISCGRPIPLGRRGLRQPGEGAPPFGLIAVNYPERERGSPSRPDYSRGWRETADGWRPLSSHAAAPISGMPMTIRPMSPHGM